MLAVLALEANRLVTTDRLIDLTQATGMRSGRNALLMGWIAPPPHCA